ncbi:hypothetical protein Q5O24_13090 [Eubacteriaceae bacterium ES3]|nr:hypothetical protein Q5O24_13090 [Eubacteriaceae bacterium ES3]
MPVNNAARWLLFAVIMTVAGGLMIVSGIMLDDYDFYWMILVGLLVFLTFFILIFVFYGQYKLLNKMFAGEEVLAHWIFDGDEHQKKIKEEYQDRKANNKSLFGIMTFFFVVITALFLIFGFDDGEDALFFFLIMLGVFAIVALAAFLAPTAGYRKMKKSLAEVYISSKSAWVMGQYIQWVAPMTEISEVILADSEDESPLIIVEFVVFQRTGPQPQTCRIPVPKNREEEAKQVAKEIAALNSVTFSVRRKNQGRRI